MFKPLDEGKYCNMQICIIAMSLEVFDPENLSNNQDVIKLIKIKISVKLSHN